ncbi:hypothetical protein PM082_007548 [Marasmius tenuissimus]|nr:hypothetical protein PM082_007548 [Marasmius tenuissimus]
MDGMVEMEEEGCRRIDGNASFPVLIIGNTTGSRHFSRSVPRCAAQSTHAPSGRAARSIRKYLATLPKGDPRHGLLSG